MELEPFLFQWWKMLDFGYIGRLQQIYAFCRFFSFRRHGHIFWPKLVLSFSLTHKLLIFFVYEVASILIHYGLRQKRISWGGEITPPQYDSVVSEASTIRVKTKYILSRVWVKSTLKTILVQLRLKLGLILAKLRLKSPIKINLTKITHPAEVTVK